LVLPLAFALRKTSIYRIVGLRFGSLAIAGCATIWLVESALGVTSLV
jgi:hypothetical protein